MLEAILRGGLFGVNDKIQSFHANLVAWLASCGAITVQTAPRGGRLPASVPIFLSCSELIYDETVSRVANVRRMCESRLLCP